MQSFHCGTIVLWLSLASSAAGQVVGGKLNVTGAEMH